MTRFAVALSGLAIVTCGGAANNPARRADGGLDAAAERTTEGGPGTSTDGGHDAADADAAPMDALPDGPPTMASLQGGWSANLPAIDGGLPSTHRRRFVGETYDETTVTPALLCGETGTFSVDADGVHFSPSRVAGQTGCTLSAAHVEPLAFANGGIAFGPAGSATVYRPVQIVPKLFPAPEVHDGDFADDVSLTGATPIAKADSLCNSSVGNPDGQSYKALLVDGVNRNATPAIDWVLRADTTYFGPDGTLNVFHTDATGLANPDANNLVEPNGGGFWLWTGLELGTFELDAGDTCQGWSSGASTDLGRIAGSNWPSFTFSSSASSPCNGLSAIWCVSQ